MMFRLKRLVADRLMPFPPQNPLFDPAWYLRRYPDVAAAHMDPWRHYVRYGWCESRDPNPYFDTSWYTLRYPDVAKAKVDPLEHYVRTGAAENRDPSPAFDRRRYVHENPDVVAAGIEPLTHFLLTGRAEGRVAHPLSLADLNQAGLEVAAGRERSGIQLVQSVAGRSFESILPAVVLDGLQGGTTHMTYRDVVCIKGPLDLALYLLLIQQLRPRTVIEIGTAHGGSALWFADMLGLHGIADPRVISIDINSLATFTDPRIDFVRGDAQRLGEVLTPKLMADIGRPLLVVDDSSHLYPDALAVLEFFDRYLRSGEYIVVEDGNLSYFSDVAYDSYHDGPNRAVAAFLEAHPADYEIDTELCDFFGYNATWNPNGWLRRR